MLFTLLEKTIVKFKWNHRWNGTANVILSKEKIELETSQYLTSKTSWYWHKNWPTDQWNKTENPKVNPNTYNHLIFDERAQAIHWCNNLFNKMCWQNWVSLHRRMKWDPYLSPYIKVNSSWGQTCTSQKTVLTSLVKISGARTSAVV